MTRLVTIQYLRAFAAIAVVIAHVGKQLHIPFDVGGGGVDLFFVVSGFIMIAILRDDTTPAGFMASRIKRIAPLYWMATTVMVLGTVAGLFPRLSIDPWHVVASYLFIPAQLGGKGPIWPILAPGWTLNFEMLFYVLVALLLPLRRPALIAAALTFVFGTAIALGLWFRPTHPVLATYTDSITLEFVFGAWIAVWWRSGKGWPRSIGVPAILLAILMTTVVITLRLPLWRAAGLGIPAALLVIGVLSLERQGDGKPERITAFLGDASYSIYLWHGLGISVTAAIGRAMGLPLALTFAVAIMAGIVGGVLSYLIVERPLMRLLGRRPMATPPPESDVATRKGAIGG
ncbi:acyltransferase family protein [Sphingomonas koreensis]